MVNSSVIASVVLTAVIVVGIPATAAAGASLKPKDGQAGTWTVEGECKRLVARNEKLVCTGEVTRAKFSDGTITFRFSDGENWLVFRTKEATARLRQGYKTILDIDGVAFGPVGSEPEFITKITNAECSYGAPYFGQAKIDCMAIVDFRMWAATVKTDGRLPVPDSEYIPPTRSAP
ncbi:hypothetical protein [Mesorhizobium onobrychidis]|uniref:Uncharacterized protein n=1 Tax=Mesorhizobium onobrychidis TaxID=2775404 RepID=A0ABY5R4B7_9HYPH|nr:hypothetical protein [Mesorhizobium onobrychidis]UVC18315.1 hypothetical protein IHQ72_15290 [Mesorhizobium onobrychidis]